ncbi:MAG: Ig-like domain-containing protein, partial [Pirellulaceae bacterium]
MNDQPLAIIDTVTVSEDPSAPVVFAKQTFTANDTPGFVGTSIKIVGVGPTTAGGIVSFDPVTESISYLPPLNFFGTDTFTYTIEDDGTTNGVADPERATATVTVTVLPVNDAPVVTQPLGTLNLVEDGPNQSINLVSRFADVDGDVLTYSVFSNSRPTLVTPTINAAGVLTLDLLDDQNGTAVIVIRATDPSGASVDNTLTLNVTPVADAPRLVNLIPDQNVLE